MKRRPEPIVGRAVRPQAELRRVEPVRTLDEYLAFLRRVRATFGTLDTPRRPTKGRHFRL